VAWAESDAAVRAMIVYGSVAQGTAADIDRVHRAAPASAEPAELRRSLLATAELYAWALDRWSQRTGQPVPRSPLTPAVMDKLRG
jgi:hypothetical protein